MPNDRNGRKLHVGDVVVIPALITGIDVHDEFCNIALETTEPMFPGPNKTPIILNTKQVELLVSMGDTAGDIDVGEVIKSVQDSQAMKAIEEK